MDSFVAVPGFGFIHRSSCKRATDVPSTAVGKKKKNFNCHQRVVRWCATARRRFSTSGVACAPHALPFLCHSKWSRARADGRRLRRRLVSPTVRRHQIDLSLAACFVDAMSSTPSAQRAVVQFYLKQGLVQAAARASSQGQVQVQETPLVTRVPGPPMGVGITNPSFASASRRTVVTLGEAAVGFRRLLRS